MPIPAGQAYRIRTGQYVQLVTHSLFSTTTNWSLAGRYDIQYDDGELDFYAFPTTPIGGQVTISGTTAAKRDGWVIGLTVGYTNTGSANSPPANSIHVTAYVLIGGSGSPSLMCIGEGFNDLNQNIIMGVQNSANQWCNWAFQGTVAEDATAGSHTAHVNISVPAGCEMELCAGQIQVGNSATAQLALAQIYDPTATYSIVVLLDSASATASQIFSFPQAGGSGVSTTTSLAGPNLYRISGGLILQLQVNTSTISLTQTFGVLARIRGGIPVVTLGDGVGTPTNTTNINSIY